MVSVTSKNALIIGAVLVVIGLIITKGKFTPKF